MNLGDSNALMEVYGLLKDTYSLTLTNTIALDDGFTIDCPIIVGKAHGKMLYLYDEDDGCFVLDVMNEEKTKGTHWHPWDVADAVADVITFMEGGEEYPLRDLG